MIQGIGKIIFSIGMAVSSLFGYHQNQPQTFAAAFTPVQASQFVLAGAGATSGATTIQLTSFTLPDPNHTKISMSMFGSVGYAVIDPQTSKIENVSFTGVTQNANNTATLTGVSRGLSFYSPYAASTTLALSHSGGAYLILTNSAAFYGKEFAFVNNPSFITSPWYFTDPPTFYNAATSTNQAASVAYVNGVAFGGTLIPKAFGGTGVTGFPAGSFIYDDGLGTTLKASSSPTFGWITATSTVGTNNFAGPIVSIGANTFTGTSTINSIILATTTITSLNATTARLGTITGNGAGITGITTPRYTYSTTTGLTTNGVGAGKTASGVLLTIPASILTASSTIEVSGNMDCSGDPTGGTACGYSITDGSGTVLASGTVTAPSSSSGDEIGPFRCVVVMNQSLSAQQGSCWQSFISRTGSTLQGVDFTSNNTTSAVNLANALTLKFVASGSTHASTLINSITAVVNP